MGHGANTRSICETRYWRVAGCPASRRPRAIRTVRQIPRPHRRRRDPPRVDRDYQRIFKRLVELGVVAALVSKCLSNEADVVDPHCAGGRRERQNTAAVAAVRWFHGIGGVGEQPVLNADSEARKVLAGIPVADDRVRIQPSQLLLQSRFDYVAARCLCSRLVDFEFK